MSLTIDFIVLCVFLIIPGVIFKRFYFYDEFSKQFSIREPLYNTLFYAIIPGIVVQIVGYVIYSSVHNQVDIVLCINSIKAIFSKEVGTNNHLSILNNTNINFLFYHQISVCMLALVLGFSLSRLIRFFKLDRKTRILRFKNEWYYIFSGEILEFKKFRTHFSNVQFSNIIEGDQFLTHIDVAIDAPNGFEFYSGFLVDYALKDSDPTELDKLFLRRACRYIPIENDQENSQDSIKSNDKENIQKLDSSNIHLRGKKVAIPGHIFILETDKLLNLNVTYIPRKKTKEQVKKGSAFEVFLNILIPITIFWLWIEIGFEINGLVSFLLYPVDLNFDMLNWVDKIILALALNYSLSVIPPSTKSKGYVALLGVLFLVLFWLLAIW